MIILGIHLGNHDSSITLLENDNVLFHIQGERTSNIKYDSNVMHALHYIKKYVDHIDYLAFTGLSGYEPVCEEYIFQIKHLSKSFFINNMEVYKFFDEHHKIHAATSFYNSGFSDALCVVIDGIGTRYNINSENLKHYGHETYSSFVAEYPNNFELIEKQITVGFGSESGKEWVDDKIYLTRSYSEGMAFEKVSQNLGFTSFDSGKVMGLSSYGKNHIIDLYEEDMLSNKFFTIKSNNNVEFAFDHKDDFDIMADLAYSLQKQAEDAVLKKIIRLLKKTNKKNLCLSGGFFLNCVSNYNLLKKLPKGIKIYAEPMSSDGGNSLGVAKFLYYKITKSKNIKKQETVYYGPKQEYTLENLKNEKIEKVSAQDVAKIISNNNIVAIYQGRSESGPRALGNRSILYDPRDINGKDHVNLVKNREWFRPFAGTVLYENAKEWFDLQSLDESKFMMFAVDVLEDKKDLIPAITHVDGTCRVQTLKKEDNLNYYSLIEEFYKITGVPILFNTSLNLAGDVINETLEDALKTLHKSQIKYLYLPELGILVTK